MNRQWGIGSVGYTTTPRVERYESDYDITSVGSTGYDMARFVGPYTPNVESINESIYSMFSNVSIPEVTINSGPIMPGIIHLRPRILPTLFFGILILCFWFSLYLFESRVYPSAFTLLLEYPLSFNASLHFMCCILFLPLLFFHTIFVPIEKRKSYWLPWAFVSEFFFVGFLCFVWFLSHQESCDKNICQMALCLNVLIVALITLPWEEERIDIVGGVVVLLVSIGTALLLTDDQHWSWKDVVAGWPQILGSLGMSITFALYIALLRKSTSGPTLGLFQIVFIHTLSATIFSSGAAAGLEIFNPSLNNNNNNNISSGGDQSSSYNFTNLHVLWKVLCLLVMAFLYKLSIIITSRFSDAHVSSVALQLSIITALLVHAAIPLLQSFVNHPETVKDYILSYPRYAVGGIIVLLTLLYWLIRVALLQCIYNRKEQQRQELEFMDDPDIEEIVT